MTPADTRIREQLKTVRDQMTTLRDQHAEAKKQRDAAKEAFGNHDFASGDPDIFNSSAFQDAEQATREAGDLADQIDHLGQVERGILEMLGQSPANASNVGNAGGDRPRMGWNGQQMLEASSEFQTARASGAFSSTSHFGSVELGTLTRDEFLGASGVTPPGPGPLGPASAGDIGTIQGAIVPDVRGIIQPALKRLSLLDIIPTGTTDSNIVQYVQVVAIPLSAAETAELATKPESGLATFDNTAPVRTIAAYVKLARQALDDVAGLSSLMNTLLPYDVRRRLELQILAGNGVGQNLTGLLHTTNVGAPAFVSGDNPADAILRAATTVILSDSDPNFVTLNPVTAQNLMLLKSGSTSGTPTWPGTYLYGAPGQVLPQTIWGLSITQNRIVPQATPLVGDSMGATLLVREGVNIRVSDADQDDFVRNRVTMLAETRVAFPVWRPTAFAVAALS